MTLLWPAAAVLGFLALAALVIALGTRSTARFEFERNRVHAQRQQMAVAAAAGQHPVGGRPGDGLPAEPPRSGAPAQPRRPEQAATGVAAHPAGRRAMDRASAWWLVDESGDQPDQPDQPDPSVLAGPFPDRIEADWAALSSGLADDVRAVYGVCRPDGTLVRRQLPQERAWLAQLGRQLDRVAEDWDGLLSDTDALTTLLVEVTAALVEAGLPLHDCAERGPDGAGAAGGVCLTPDPDRGGILVSWRQHDRMSLQQVRGAEVDAAVQRTMNGAVADVLAQMDFRVTPFGSTGCHLVTAAQWSALAW
ncbi:hypothetical protein SAMN04488085_101262 [Geodermatophilus ruber]|uniref:Uncharacterized protein n=2 Tax=Geodermatophilus ruber TaxID=504800 RepID=A0A1I3YYM9_9ACTN|nr:hypothetical protein SAMN04488085_101262 [Geodermatophilus ruber]